MPPTSEDENVSPKSATSLPLLVVCRKHISLFLNPNHIFIPLFHPSFGTSPPSFFSSPCLPLFIPSAMGCGGSKLVGEDDGHGRIQALIWRRFEEIKRRRTVTLRGTGTLSKKQLLKGTSEDDYSSKCDSLQQDDDHKVSVSSQEENLKVAPAPFESNGTLTKDKVSKIEDESVEATPLVGLAKVAAAPEPAKQDDSKKCIEAGDKINKEREEKEMEAIATAMELMDIITKTDGDTDEEETEDSDEDDEYGRLSGVDDGRFFPGSPSFRVYFIESLANDEKDDDDDDEQHNTDKVSEDMESVQASVKSSNSLEDSETKIKKKSKRSAGTRFKRVIAKRKPAAMKNLLNVSSCYNPACSRSDKASSLPPKPKVVS